MRDKRIGRVGVVRRSLTFSGCAVLVGFIAGCCTCKVPYQDKILLIVKQPSSVSSSQFDPEGAAIGFTKIADGDQVRIVNRYGKSVKVTFPAGVIAGEREFTLGKCDEREVTIALAGSAPAAVNVVFDSSDGHGGADMIIEPPGGGG